MSLAHRLAALGLVLPGTAAPGARYAAAVVHGDTAWVDGFGMVGRHFQETHMPWPSSGQLRRDGCVEIDLVAAL